MHFRAVFFYVKPNCPRFLLNCGKYLINDRDIYGFNIYDKTWARSITVSMFLGQIDGSTTNT